MQALVLAAGKSSRIFRDIKKNKCLIEINNKTLILKLIEDFEYYGVNKINVSVGYKKENIISSLENKKINFINNIDYNNTGITHSMITSLKEMNHEDTIVVYSDILFNKKLIKKILKKNFKNLTLPILKNWSKVWNKRKQNILDDAESLITKNNRLVQIGQKITNINHTKYQYMGIVYVPKKFIKILIKYYEEMDNKIDMTTYINFLLSKKIIVETSIYSGKWYEFDTLRDLKNFK